MDEAGRSTPRAGTRAELEADVSRRGFASLLALLGGGAALAACAAPEEAAGGSVAALSSASQWGWVDAATELRALPGVIGGATVNRVLALGSRAAGDGGGGLFTWVAGASGDDGGVTFAATGGRWTRLDRSPVDVRWWNSLRATDADDASGMFQAAIARAYALATDGGAGVVRVPRGGYVVKKQVLVRNTGPSDSHKLEIVGDGAATLVIFAPLTGADAVLFNFDNGSVGAAGPRQFGCGLRRLAIQGQGLTSPERTAVRLLNTDNFTLEDVIVTGFFTSTSTAASGSPALAIAVKVIGGQAHRLARLTVDAERALSLEAPGVAINCDHLWVEDFVFSGLSRTRSDHCVFIAQSVLVTNLVMRGGSMLGARNGVTWENGGAGGNHANLRFADIRGETWAPLPAGATDGYTFSVQGFAGEQAVRNLSFSNFMIGRSDPVNTGPGPLHRGVRVSATTNLSFDGVVFNCDGDVALAVPDSCGFVEADNVWFPNAGPAVSLGPSVRLLARSSHPYAAGRVPAGFSGSFTALPDGAETGLAQRWDVYERSHRKTIPGGSTITLPFVPASGLLCGTITVVAHDAATGVSAGATYMITSSAITKLSGTANTVDTVPASGNLGVYRSGGVVTVNNQLKNGAAPVNVTALVTVAFCD
ncbi:MAG: hypothetical protein U0324_23810 [Polyangiales bacterium]